MSKAPNALFKRVVVKLSGEALMGPDTHGLHAPTLQRIAASTEGTHPDAYIYSVVCDEAGCDVMIHEPHLPEAIHSLFERTLADD